MKLELNYIIDEINTFVADRPLGDRMKAYENLTRFNLPNDYPLIIRLDGNAFHTFTRGFTKPFDTILRTSLEETAQYLLENIPGAQMAYHQSDEISILVTEYNISNTKPWFDNNINKIVSITASMATLAFNRIFRDKVLDAWEDAWDENPYASAIKSGAMFDSRVFLLPKDEVANYFIWRQQDAIKNAISMVAQSLFPHKSLQGLSGPQMIEKMNAETYIVYEEMFKVVERRGSVIHRLEPLEHEKTIVLKNGGSRVVKYMRSSWGIDENIPVFKDNREYIEKFI